MSTRSPFSPRRRSDLWTLAIAAGLLGLVGLWWLSLSHEAGVERDRIVAQVPAFPARGQPAHERGRPAPPAPAVQIAMAPVPDAGPRPPPPPTADETVKRFLLNADPKGVSGVMHFNSLMNAPILDKLDQCFPKAEMQALTSDGGFDFTRDIDQVAFTDKGSMLTGFFDENGAKRLAGCEPPTSTRSYRGFTIFGCQHEAIAVQPSLVLRGAESDIEALVDQALSAPPPGSSSEDIYGDIYMRSGVDEPDPKHPPGDAVERMLNAALSQASNVTMRANVWDSVALSVDAEPRPGQSADDLAATTNAALALVKDSIDSEDVQLTAYTDLAKIKAENGKLQVNLALPTDKLVEQLNGICKRQKEAFAAREKYRKEHPDEADDDGEGSEGEWPAEGAAEEPSDPEKGP